MKGNQDHPDADEHRCRIAGDVIERAMPAARPALDAAQWDRLRAALTGPSPAPAPRSGRRRRVLIATLAAAAVAGGGVGALFLLRSGPITFVVQGGAQIAGATGGRIETAADQPAALRFSDGSRVALAGASAGRVVERSADGARFSVDYGRARFDVVHRARTRWTVSAGPFEVLVTGTSFDVDWSGAQARTLAVDLHAGAVTVRGGLAGDGVSLHEGQRLVADLDRGRLTVGAIGGAEPSGSPAVDAPALAGAGQRAGAPDDAGDAVEESGERGDRGRSSRVTPPAPARTTGAATPAPTIERPRGEPALASLPGFDPASPSPGRSAPGRPGPPEVEPAPWPAPALGGDGKLAAGGSACLGWSPQIRFDRMDQALDGVEVASAMSLAFNKPAIDHARTWCGAGSLRVDARFDLAGTPNRLGHQPRHAGEVLVDLPEPVDLTGKTVTVHFFVEGPSDIRFAAQVFAIHRPASGDPRWVGAGFTPGLTTGRWWTLTHAFERDNRLFEGGTSAVDAVGRVSLQVYAIGADRVWTGRVFVDDIGWQ